MGKFFQGWRRKAGLVALIGACLICAIWMRTLFVWDWIQITTGPVQNLVVSAQHRVLWCRWDRGPHAGPETSWWTFKAAPATVFKGPERDHVKGRAAYIELHYWRFVVPLVLVATYLILWKPGPVSTQSDGRCEE